MERRQLEYFVAVVDHGGFHRAAEAVHVSQPSLSQAIGSLEKDLGTPLFHRLGRKVKLTAAGEALLPPARQVLRDHAVARAAVARVRGRYDGDLDLATTPTLAVHPLTQILGQFADRYPGVRVNITDLDVPGGANAIVGGGSCEVGLVRLPLPPASTLRVTSLLREAFCLLLPPGSTVEDDPVDLSILGELPLITTPLGSSSRTGLHEALTLAGVGSPTIAVETIYRVTIPSLVGAGVGAAFLPERIAEDAERMGARKVRTTPTIWRETALVYRDGPLSPAAAAFVDLAVELAPFAPSAKAGAAKAG